MLGEIVAVAEREEVDLVIVAGDQFDSAVPSPEAERIVYRTLLRLAGTGARVVAIAGNHDNPRRLRAVGPLLKLAGISTAAFVSPPEKGGVLRHTTKSGEEARIALFPFQSKRGIVKAADLMESDPDDHQKSYAERCRLIAGRLCESFRADTVNLIAAHLTVVGSATGGGERATHVFDYYVPADIFPESAHYVALGHIHKPQRIGGRCPIRYAGSPLALDFGETHEGRTVEIIEAKAGLPAEVRSVPITAGRRLRTIGGSMAEVQALAGTTGDDFLRIRIEDAPFPGLADRVRELFPHAVDVTVRSPDGASKQRRTDPEALRGDPGVLFRRYLEESGIGGKALAGLFDELLAERYGFASGEAKAVAGGAAVTSADAASARAATEAVDAPPTRGAAGAASARRADEAIDGSPTQAAAVSEGATPDRSAAEGVGDAAH